MKLRALLEAGGLAAFSLTLLVAPVVAGSKEEDQKEIVKIHDETLRKLYQIHPSAQRAVEGSAGHAVFKNFGMKIFVAGGGSGKGLAVDNVTKQQTYMKMVELQAGLGIGVKKFQLVWVFENKQALHQFVDQGWVLGAQASAAAQTGEKGKAYSGAVAVAPGVWMYQLVGDGLAAELTAKGTKYYKDKDLN